MKKFIYTFLFVLLLGVFFTPTFSAYAQNSTQETQIFEQNAFRIMRQTDDAGKITITYIFPINSKLFVKSEFLEKEIVTYKFYLTTYVNALAKSNRQKQTSGVNVGNCVYYTDVDGLGFSIEFDNLDAQKTFFGVKENEESQSEIDTSGLFVKTATLRVQFPISLNTAKNLKQICTMAVESWSVDCSISAEKRQQVTDFLEDSVFIYDFSSQNADLQSNLTYTSGDFMHNVFVKNLAEIEQNEPIEFWTKSINRPIWYLSALMLVCGGVFLALFCVRAKQKRASNKTL